MKKQKDTQLDLTLEGEFIPSIVQISNPGRRAISYFNSHH